MAAGMPKRMVERRAVKKADISRLEKTQRRVREQKMKIAYVFATGMASTFKLASMILPQLEQGFHKVDVVGMMFFDDNIFCLRQGDPVGERLARIAKEKNILLMVCDQCAVRRNLAEGTFEMCGTGSVTAKGMVEGVVTGCFPQLYEALSASPPDQVITL
jgi:sulfur relay (sulfurtransferase) complex TusBCD TusD component (DsrE family)